MKKTLNIIFTIDESYIQHFTVALISLIENNKNIHLNVFIIHDINDPAVLNKVMDFFMKQYGLKISLLSLDNSTFDNYKITHHVSKATYFRLMIADIIPSHVEKAVFLDSDIVVTGSLELLIDLDFGTNFLLAVNDKAVETLSEERLNKLGIPSNKYFNAGVMLLNIKAWRENNVSIDLIATADKYMNDLVWWDQDVLNIYFIGKWGQLASTYNEKDIVKRLDNYPVIIHYAGSSKPWHYLNKHPYKNIYWKYLRLSPFKDYKFQDVSIKNVIKKMLFLITSV